MQRVSDYFRLASLWRWLRAAYVALAFAAATTAIAAESPSRELQAGQYMTEGGMASLSVSAAEASGQSFQISSEGVNGSFCGVSGTIKEGEAGVTALGSEPALVCKIGFQDNGNAVSVTILQSNPGWEHCRFELCGLRATFEGTYFPVPPDCANTARRDTRERFARAMRDGSFQRAYDVLGQLQRQCTRFLNWIEVDEVHNDLAAALHRLDRDQECLEELNRTQGGAAGSLPSLRKHFLGLPADLERYQPTAQTTWKLQTLCGRTHMHSG